MSAMPGIIMYSKEYESIREILSQSQKGDLLDALMEFGQTGKVYTGKSQLVKLAFGLLSATIRREQEKYLATCERNAEKARKRWEKERNQSAEAGGGENAAEMYAQNTPDDLPWDAMV